MAATTTQCPSSRAQIISRAHTDTETKTHSRTPRPKKVHFAAMTHSFSRSWKSPAQHAKERWIRILKARDHICPASPYLDRVLKVTEHERVIANARTILSARKTTATTADATVRAEYAIATSRSVNALAPMGGKTFGDNRSMVLGLPTVWTPTFELGRDFTAPWPSVAEMKYEGDERVSTSAGHRRFLPCPRYPCDRPEIPFGQVAFMPQYELDRTDIIGVERTFFLTHKVDDIEIGTEEEIGLLGGDLAKELDPKGVYVTEAFGHGKLW